MTRMPPARRPRALAALPAAALLGLAACTQMPAYQPPAAPPAAQWKETAPGWMAAAPADTLARGPWWTLFGDPALDTLVAQVAISNQNVAAAAAAVAQSQALLREQRAGLVPTLGLSAGANRSGGGGSSNAGNQFTLGLGASWEPDLWGRVGAGVTAAGARAQASAADLANATLSAQAAFVSDYLGLREADAEIAIIRDTIEGYRRALQITQNRYAAAIAQKSDVLQAQTQLAGAQADLAGLEQTRAQLVHAMAVLVGQAPSTFDVPPGEWQSTVVPSVPVGIPSELLQRRPDIAAAERAVAAANADVGVARSAWFPSLTLSASGGQGAARLGDLFNASATTWSFGLAIAETLFDGGARSAAIDASRAAWQQSVAQYRQTVLAAFQAVEDQLSASSSLEQQQALRRAASQAADQTEQQMLNRYKQGLVAYTDVVTAQASALSARRALLQVSLQRQTTAVTLIAALGGGWSAPAAAG
jgi:NodT family efflux transporter outer membrane factor (OMF) lipoprotein